MLLSEDGAHLYRVTVGLSGPEFVQLHLESINLKTGRSRQIADLPSMWFPSSGGRSTQSVIGFMDEGKRVLIAGSRGDAQLVLSVDIESGNVIELVSEDGSGFHRSWTCTVSDPFDATVLVAIRGPTRLSRPREAVIHVYDLANSAIQRTPITLPAGSGRQANPIVAGGVPAVYPDGSRLLSGSGSILPILDIDLGSGEFTFIESPIQTGIFEKRISIPTQGDRFAIGESFYGSGNETSILIHDTRRDDWVARLTMRRPLGSLNSTFSRNGRRLATIGSYRPLNAGLGSPYLHKLVLHDLTTLEEE